MGVEGMKKLIWVTIGIFVAFIVLWLYVSEAQNLEEEQRVQTSSALSFSLVTDAVTKSNIWEFLEKKQSESEALEELENGVPTTTIAGETTTANTIFIPIADESDADITSETVETAEIPETVTVETP
ncbi:MAG: hypothetical protein LBM93_05005 [Oscillospiraceae bacterium]|nr:hypothetical protein [Oscillospiraceae bacterium]